MNDYMTVDDSDEEDAGSDAEDGDQEQAVELS
jgi:hypothetical protein